MRFKNRGQEMLAGLRDSRAEIAAKSGAAPSQLSYWINGERLPGPKWRPLLREAYGIPEGAWDLRPGEEDLSHLPVPSGEPSSAKVRPARATPPEGTSRDEGGSLIEVNDHLAELRDRLDNETMTVSERTKLQTVYTQTLSVKSRLEAAEEMKENRIVRDHPSWKKLKTAIYDALKPYPLVAREVAEAVQRALGETA